MLYARSQRSYQPWTRGAAEFLCNHRQGRNRLIIGVPCRLGQRSVTDVGLLDTGAEWSIVPPALAEQLASELGPDQGDITLSSRYGITHAKLHPLAIHLLADPGLGQDLKVSAVVAVPDRWDGPVVLGYLGFLEKLRIALESAQGNQAQSLFFFGPA